MADLVVAMTGASGAVYGLRLIQVLLSASQRVHLTISRAAAQVLAHELGIRVDLENFDPTSLLNPEIEGIHAEQQALLTASSEEIEGSSSIFSDTDTDGGQLVYHHHSDFTAGIASGSFRTGGMVICPCSMGTLAAIAGGLSTNLIHRAADVHLKERRRIVLVPRETPLGLVQLENMRNVAAAGAIVLPAAPGFYHRPQGIGQLVDFVVSRICDQLGIEHELINRWGEDAGE